jgi:periplasmic divalent cation tolerance protein
MKNDQEVVLLLKTFPEHNETLQTFLAKHHSYNVPCIMHWETEVNEAYGKWMKEVLK